MSFRLLAALPMLLAVACDADQDGLKGGEEKDFGSDPKVADSDGDGLSDGDERALGSDPKVVDTDGDGLSDGDEHLNGADPNVVDTDGDGYRDGDEVAAGHAPNAAEDKIYEGGWPYYADKESIEGSDMSGMITVGERFGRFKALDQWGQEVDLYDFYNADKPVVIDMSAQWCPPCNSVAAWLDGEELSWMEPMNPIRRAVNKGDVYWVTVLIEDNGGDPATKKTAKEWYKAYPSDEVPVLADTEWEVAYYMPAYGIPAFALLTPELIVDTYDPANGYAALEKLNRDLMAIE